MPASAALLLASAPIPRTSLIGREAERAAAQVLLLEEAVPLLTLTGPAGVGKTRLALAIADEAACPFADGVMWVFLPPLIDPALVPAAVATALGITLAADRSVVEALTAPLR